LPETYDIAVIGGGISGISLAARLAPSARVVVLEAEEHLGTHATGRSAALLVEA
jgi:D-arginine dehydrogenase